MLMSCMLLLFIYIGLIGLAPNYSAIQKLQATHIFPDVNIFFFFNNIGTLKFRMNLQILMCVKE